MFTAGRENSIMQLKCSCHCPHNLTQQNVWMSLDYGVSRQNPNMMQRIKKIYIMLISHISKHNVINQSECSNPSL